MVQIALALDKDGALERLNLCGHAPGARKGENLACAAVTLLARSVARLLTSRSGWIIDGNALEPGNLSLVINKRPKDTTEWLKGVSDTLIRALADIDEEYPSALSVQIEERQHGS